MGSPAKPLLKTAHILPTKSYIYDVYLHFYIYIIHDINPTKFVTLTNLSCETKILIPYQPQPLLKTAYILLTKPNNVCNLSCQTIIFIPCQSQPLLKTAYIFRTKPIIYNFYLHSHIYTHMT